MKRILAVLTTALTLGLAASAPAAVTITPTSNPSVAVNQGQPVSALIQNTDPAAQKVRVNTNYSTTLTVTDGSSCPLVSIKRGTSRWECNVPQGGAIFYSTFELAATTYITAFSTTGTILGNVAYLSTPTPFSPTIYTITCAYKGWGYYVAPPGCPPIT